MSNIENVIAECDICGDTDGILSFDKKQGAYICDNCKKYERYQKKSRGNTYRKEESDE